MGWTTDRKSDIKAGRNIIPHFLKKVKSSFTFSILQSNKRTLEQLTTRQNGCVHVQSIPQTHTIFDVIVDDEV